MNQITKLEPTPASSNPTTQGSTFPKPHNPYARMSQRRAIACTICAKAKTKCDKAVRSGTSRLASSFANHTTGTILLPLHSQGPHMRASIHPTHIRQQLPQAHQAPRLPQEVPHQQLHLDPRHFATQRSILWQAPHDASGFADGLPHSSKACPATHKLQQFQHAYAAAHLHTSGH